MQMVREDKDRKHCKPRVGGNNGTDKRYANGDYEEKRCKSIAPQPRPYHAFFQAFIH